jgi:hypothetical protein
MARDDGRYAQSPHKQWFDSLKSKKGPCCSDADGTALKDVEWRNQNGRYQVLLRGEWIDVPDDAVLNQPNLFGQAIVWEYPDLYGYKGADSIRCFIAGTGS